MTAASLHARHLHHRTARKWLHTGAAAAAKERGAGEGEAAALGWWWRSAPWVAPQCFLNSALCFVLVLHFYYKPTTYCCCCFMTACCATKP